MRAELGVKFNKGFTYIGLLLFIAINGICLSVAGMSWQYQVRAEKEKQLLFVGAAFRNAINNYYASTPDAAKTYPASLDDLLLDKRMPNIKRHLRKVYLDPMTGKADWGFVTQQGRIVGVYSQSILSPLKKAGFDLTDAGLNGAKSYQDWIFGSITSNNQKTKVVTSESSNLSSEISFSSVQSSNVNNSKNGDSQEAIDKQGASSALATQESQEGKVPSRKLTMLEYLLKNGVWPDKNYYLNKPP